ncbi:HNH endonuclease [Nonomuraea roseoviolacea]|uniref:HNH endonuclease n=1 Tax=Nonomuraea roseoviolacea TaxID=103837 RepID=UPI003CD0BA4E
MRRALEYGSAVEAFANVEVFERDGWLCQLCGDPVDREADFPHPLYPTLDHIVPLSKGGEHSRANTQLAHYRCNLMKGARMAA